MISQLSVKISRSYICSKFRFLSRNGILVNPLKSNTAPYLFWDLFSPLRVFFGFLAHFWESLKLVEPVKSCFYEVLSVNLINTHFFWCCKLWNAPSHLGTKLKTIKRQWLISYLVVSATFSIWVFENVNNNNAVCSMLNLYVSCLFYLLDLKYLLSHRICPKRWPPHLLYWL